MFRKLLLYTCLFLCFYIFCSRIFSISNEKNNTTYTSTINHVVQTAEQQYGIPYQYGGTSSKGFDCSGLVYYSFQKSGIAVPRSSKGYANFGKTITLANAQKGDVIVFKDTNPKKKTIGHVGIVLSNMDEKITFIHSSSSKRNNGVVATKLFESKHYQKRFMKIVRINI
ncbi:MAG: C40 family peptidase [Chitinophagales bacterium]